MSTTQDVTDGMKYVRSLRDAVKRRYAVDYLEWIRAGRHGIQPGRGALPSGLARAVCQNLDALG